MKYFTVIILLLLFACDQKPSHPYSENQVLEFTNQFNTHIQDKDNYWKTGEDSPLLENDKPEFQGLDYFNYDPAFRFEGPITKYENPDTIIIYGKREGDERPSLKYGYFAFNMANQEYRLQIYDVIRSKPDQQNYLFLGFTDETSNAETYGGGRYIDIEKNQENFYIVDFNFAYNPYCAYNPKYSCAIPTKENYLKIKIKAGEKKFHH